MKQWFRKSAVVLRVKLVECKILKQFCAQLEAMNTALPIYTPTGWITLGIVLEMMIKLWEPLTQHFLSLR